MMRGGVGYVHGRGRHRAVAAGHFCRAWTSAIVIAASVLGASERTACAQTSGSAVELQFDIPSQPLVSALKAYSSITSLELFYESSLVEGHRSSSIHGLFSRDIALRHLLEGTSLSVASFEPGTITILPPALPAKQSDLAAVKSKAAEFTPYLGLIQTALRSAFCRAPAIQTDTAELIIRLWIAPSGAVARADVLSPTGSDERDRAYAAAMRGLVIDEPPPRGMPQPVTLMVLPRASRSAAECTQPGETTPVRGLVHE
jgi:hypothetical protein